MEIARAQLPRLESLELCGGFVSDVGVSYLATMRARVRRLNLGHNSQITDAAVKRLAEKELRPLPHIARALQHARHEVSAAASQRIHHARGALAARLPDAGRGSRPATAQPAEPMVRPALGRDARETPAQYGRAPRGLSHGGIEFPRRRRAGQRAQREFKRSCSFTATNAAHTLARTGRMVTRLWKVVLSVRCSPLAARQRWRPPRGGRPLSSRRADARSGPAPRAHRSGPRSSQTSTRSWPTVLAPASSFSTQVGGLRIVSTVAGRVELMDDALSRHTARLCAPARTVSLSLSLSLLRRPSPHLSAAPDVVAAAAEASCCVADWQCVLPLRYHYFLLYNYSLCLCCCCCW
jgi:hypothetical protein